MFHSKKHVSSSYHITLSNNNPKREQRRHTNAKGPNVVWIPKIK